MFKKQCAKAGATQGAGGLRPRR